MEHFDFWHADKARRKKETETVSSFFSLERWAEKMSFCIEFLLNFQIIYIRSISFYIRSISFYIRPIRFQFQIGLKYLII